MVERTLAEVEKKIKVRRHYDNFIGGEWVQAAKGGTREILNPATNELLAVVSDGSSDDVRKAVAFARAAFDQGPWPKMRARAV